jgi:hypothetical protein
MISAARQIVMIARASILSAFAALHSRLLGIACLLVLLRRAGQHPAQSEMAS